MLRKKPQNYASRTLSRTHDEKLEDLAERIRLRKREDIYFAKKAISLGQQLISQFGKSIRSAFAFPKTGAELLESMVLVSRDADITSLVFYGHASSTGIYMMEDRGFYNSLAELARDSLVVTGTISDRIEKLRLLGARDLRDLHDLLVQRKIRFADDAVIIFLGCNVAGKTGIEPRGFAAQVSEIAGATVIASVNVTDGSVNGSQGLAPSSEFSAGTWAKFQRGSPPRDLKNHILDLFDYIGSDFSQRRNRELSPIR